MIIRKTAPKDLPAIAALYESARASLRSAGIDQWQTGDYPNENDARADMEAGTGYVLEDGGKVVAAACLAFGHEPTYDVIDQGAWGYDEPYGFLHRVAVSPEAKGKGAAGLFFDELKRQAKERGVRVLRGDTHPDNKPMQRVMAKNGLIYRGVIYVEDGTQRLAYEVRLG